MKIGIRYKLLFGFALLVGLSFIIQSIIFIAVDRYTRNQIDSLHLEKAIAASREITTFLSSIELRAVELARLYEDDLDPKKEKFTGFAKVIISSSKHIEKVSVLAPSGREVIQMDNSGRIPEAKLSIDLPTVELEKALRGEKAFSKVFYLNDASSPYVDMYYPLELIGGGEGKGVVKLLLNLNELWDVVAATEHENSGFSYIVDAQGIVIAHPNVQLITSRADLSDRSIIAALIKKSTYSDLRKTESIIHTQEDKINNNTDTDISDQERTYINEQSQKVTAQGVFIPGPNWFIVFEHLISEAYSFPFFIRDVFIISLAWSLVLLLLIAVILSNNLTKPILKLKEATNLLKTGKLETRIHLHSRDELEDLSGSFNVMARNLQDLVFKLEQEKNILSAERNKIAIALSSITDGVIAVNMDRKIIIFNKAAEKITGFSLVDVMEKSIDDILHLSDASGKINQEVYCPIRTDDFEGVVYSSDNIVLNAKREAFINLTVGKIKEGKDVNLGCILALHDITHEKELEEMKLDFVSMAAHELRTPLTSIRGYLSVFQEEDIPLNPEQQMFLKRISIASDQLVALVENLLNVTKIEKGVMVLNKKPVNLLEMVYAIIDSLKEPADQKHIAVTIVNPDASLPLINVDAFRISEVITNLLANAISYTEKGGSVVISFEQIGTDVVTHIADTGQGIPREALSHLFTKFYRVSGKLEQGSKGTGLGLYIAKAIIDMHGGRIWVDSIINKGSTFSFSLPKGEKT